MRWILLLILNIFLCSASLPEAYVPEYYGSYCEQDGTVVEPMLGASYNLWEMSYTTGNPNNDYILWFPINDRLYSGSFYEGDTIYYQQAQPDRFYTLLETTLSDWLTYNMRDTDGDDLVEYSEMRNIQNRFFQQGEPQTPLGGITVLILLAIAYATIKILNTKKKK